jgi:hypothetical protein
MSGQPGSERNTAASWPDDEGNLGEDADMGPLVHQDEVRENGRTRVPREDASDTGELHNQHEVRDATPRGGKASAM